MREIKFQTKSEILYQKFKRSILDGAYKPGQRIVISEIAKKFGTSTSPVREAIKNLESEGLVKINPHIGAVVTDINMDDMEKIYPIRIELEGLAAREAVRKIKESDLKLLGKIIEDMGKALSEKQFEKFGSLNREFHRVVCESSENEYLCKFIFELWDLCFRSPGIFELIPKIAPQAHEGHKKILRALKKRDGVLVEKLILNHKKRSLNNLKTFFKGK